MRPGLLLCALALGGAATASAQQRDTTARRDTVPKTPADSAAAADSAFLERELKRGATDPSQPSPAGPSQQTGATGPVNPRLLPDVSAVGDLVADLSPDGTTQEDGSRFGVREVEVAVQAAVDPYFRGDVFLGLSDAEGVAIEQAYLTSTSLPFGLEVRLGRFLMPVGKQNTTHRHDLHTIEYPYVLQRFLGEEGLKGTGVWASKIFAPFGFYQELLLTAVDRIGEPGDSLTAAAAVNRRLSGLGYSARLRNYVDLSQSANVELSASATTGRREQPFDCLDALDAVPCTGGVNAVAARQSVVGADFTYRWRPLQQGLYKSFILQAEAMRQLNERTPSAGGLAGAYGGPTRAFDGAYVFARYQLTRRLFVGSRYDYLEDPASGGETLNAGSGYLEWFPSEFSKLVAGYERREPSGGDGMSRIILQAAFSLGPHKPHPF